MADLEVQELSKLSQYEFNIRMFTKLCDVYSDIKGVNITDAKSKLTGIIHDLDTYYEHK